MRLQLFQAEISGESCESNFLMLKKRGIWLKKKRTKEVASDHDQVVKWYCSVLLATTLKPHKKSRLRVPGNIANSNFQG